MVEYYPPLLIPPKKGLTRSLKRPFYPDRDCVLCLLPEINTKWLDQTLNGNDGTMSVAVAKDMGRRGQAMYFDGSSAFVKCATSTDFDLDIGSFEAWIKPAVSQNTNTRLIQIGAGQNRTSLAIAATGGILHYGRNGGGTIFETTSTKTVNDNKWHHVVGVYNSKGAYSYVDGVVQGSDTGDCTLTIDSTVSLWLGIYTDESSVPYAGYIDEVRIYNRALVAWEIKALYEQGKP